jgi:hypothetical protein
MEDKTLKILLGIIALNLTVQTLKAVDIFPTASADVAGMSRYDLRRDRDFKRAVEDVISGNCYVDDEYIYC